MYKCRLQLPEIINYSFTNCSHFLNQSLNHCTTNIHLESREQTITIYRRIKIFILKQSWVAPNRSYANKSFFDLPDLIQTPCAYFSAMTSLFIAKKRYTNSIALRVGGVQYSVCIQIRNVLNHLFKVISYRTVNPSF